MTGRRLVEALTELHTGRREIAMAAHGAPARPGCGCERSAAGTTNHAPLRQPHVFSARAGLPAWPELSLPAMNDGVPSRQAAGRTDERSRATRLVGAFALAAGVIHAVALVQHFSEAFLYGVFFAIVASCQLAWGSWVYRHPDDRRFLAAGAIASTAIVVIWALSRTTGVPLIPQVGQAEAIGLLDLLATCDELAIAALVTAILLPDGPLGTRLARLSKDQATRLVAALITTTLLAIMLGGHTH